MTQVRWCILVLILAGCGCSSDTKYPQEDISGIIRWNWSSGYGRYTHLYEFSQEVKDDGTFVLTYAYTDNDPDEHKAELLSELHRFELYPNLSVPLQKWFIKGKLYQNLWLVDKKTILVHDKPYDVFKYISDVKAENKCVKYYSTYWNPDFGVIILNTVHYTYQSMAIRKTMAKPINAEDSLKIKVLLDSINNDVDFRMFEGAQAVIEQKRESKSVQWCSDRLDEIDDPEQFHSIYQFVEDSVKYPDSALESCISGSGTLDIYVDTSGSIKRQRIWLSEKTFMEYTPMFERACERLISAIPRLAPASYMGRKIETHYVLPIKFNLPDFVKCADILTARSENQQSRPINPVYTIVEQMPQFAGGEEKLEQYLNNALIYPEVNDKNHLGYTVYVTFVVGLEGEIINPKVLHAKENPQKSEYIAEALRVIQDMPTWEPGQQRGKTVRVQYNLPVRFRGA